MNKKNKIEKKMRRYEEGVGREWWDAEERLRRGWGGFSENPNSKQLFSIINHSLEKLCENMNKKWVKQLFKNNIKSNLRIKHD